MNKWENRDRKLSRRRSLKELNAGYKEPENDQQKNNKKLRKEVDKIMKEKDFDLSYLRKKFESKGVADEV